MTTPDNWPRSLDIVWWNEVDRRKPDRITRDSGGITKYGISQKAYPTLDIAHLTPEQAKALYQRDYWAPIRGDGIPWPLCVVAFDAAVNQGVGMAKRWLAKTQDVGQFFVLREGRYRYLAQQNPDLVKYVTAPDGSRGPWLLRLDRLREAIR